MRRSLIKNVYLINMHIVYQVVIISFVSIPEGHYSGRKLVNFLIFWSVKVSLQKNSGTYAPNARAYVLNTYDSLFANVITTHSRITPLYTINRNVYTTANCLLAELNFKL